MAMWLETQMLVKPQIIDECKALVQRETRAAFLAGHGIAEVVQGSVLPLLGILRRHWHIGACPLKELVLPAAAFFFGLLPGLGWLGCPGRGISVRGSPALLRSRCHRPVVGRTDEQPRQGALFLES